MTTATLVWRLLWFGALIGFLVFMANVGKLAADKLASYREPGGCTRFALEQFGFTPDPFQRDLFDAFENPSIQRISLQACAGPGKTAGLAVCGWYFLATQCSYDGSGFEHPNGFATSVTEDNLRDNLWKEFGKWQARSSYLSKCFRWTAERIFALEAPATWWLSARTWPKSGTAEEQGRTFSGLHGKNVLVLVDESGSIPATVLRAAEQALPSTRFGKVVQGGNPLSLQGMLYEAANRLRHLWHIIVVTGDPDDPRAWVHSPRVATAEPGQQTPAAWARDMIAAYGRDNPWVMAYVLGRFPPSSINSLLSHEEVLAAMDRELRPEAYEHMQRRIGIDVARFGDDRTVLWPRQGLRSFNPVVLRNADTNAIVARVLIARERWGSELELIDNSFAWGNGVVDNLVNAGANPHPVNFAGQAGDKRYKNRRAEMWLKARDAVRDLGATLPKGVPELVAELCEPTYTFVNGVFVLEDKDLIKKRLGRSPDLGDAWALTYSLPDMPTGVSALTGLLRNDGARPGHAATSYNPLAKERL